MKYDYLVVGAGLYGSILASRAKTKGKKVLVIDRRAHIGGNVYSEVVEGIQVHKYGPHIFHTSNKSVWDFMNSVVPFNHFHLCPLASYKGKLYHLPFNMNTFYAMWGTIRPEEAMEILENQRLEMKGKDPRNLEEQAIALVGREIFEKLIKCYTEKQWGRDCKDLPPFIIKRLPVRFTYNNNYFNDTYQGIPIGGYTKIFKTLLDGIEVKLNTNYFENREYFDSCAETIIYCGPIDEFFNFKFGPLEYRSLYFEEELIQKENYQGNAIVNYTDHDHAYTRIIEHKHFEFGNQPYTVITREYPMDWKPGKEAYYPVNDIKNSEKYAQYKVLADRMDNVWFCGRLAEYKYYDMHQIVELALQKDI